MLLFTEYEDVFRDVRASGNYELLDQDRDDGARAGHGDGRFRALSTFATDGLVPLPRRSGAASSSSYVESDARLTVAAPDWAELPIRVVLRSRYPHHAGLPASLFSQRMCTEEAVANFCLVRGKQVLRPRPCWLKIVSRVR